MLKLLVNNLVKGTLQGFQYQMYKHIKITHKKSIIKFFLLQKIYILFRLRP